MQKFYKLLIIASGANGNYMLCNKIFRLFYSRKYKNGNKITRILFFKFVSKNVTPPIYKPFIPNIPYIGRCSYSGKNIYIANKDTKIGNFCSIGERCILGHGEHPINYLTTSPYLYFDRLGYKSSNVVSHNEFWDSKPIEICNDVWIGDSVFIKNGIRIGDGAIVGAYSVVTKDVPPYAIVVGNPAKIIKYRFDSDTIDFLLKAQWWNLPDEIIKELPYDNMDDCIDYLRKLAL